MACRVALREASVVPCVTNRAALQVGLGLQPWDGVWSTGCVGASGWLGLPRPRPAVFRLWGGVLEGTGELSPVS